MDTRILIATLRTRGIELRVNGDRIHAEASQEPDSNTKVLLDEVRRRRKEVISSLAATPCWNCGAEMAETIDIHGRRWWKCWECAVTI